MLTVRGYYTYYIYYIYCTISGACGCAMSHFWINFYLKVWRYVGSEGLTLFVERVKLFLSCISWVLVIIMPIPFHACIAVHRLTVYLPRLTRYDAVVVW